MSLGTFPNVAFSTSVPASEKSSGTTSHRNPRPDAGACMSPPGDGNRGLRPPCWNSSNVCNSVLIASCSLPSKLRISYTPEPFFRPIMHACATKSGPCRLTSATSFPNSNPGEFIRPALTAANAASMPCPRRSVPAPGGGVIVPVGATVLVAPPGAAATKHLAFEIANCARKDMTSACKSRSTSAPGISIPVPSGCC